MCVDGSDPVGVYFGTTTGEIWGSADEGSDWTLHRRAPARDLLGRSRRCDRTRREGPHPDAAAVVHGERGERHGRRDRRWPRCCADLDRQFPGIAFRVVDEQGRLRQHMVIWLDDERCRDLSTPVDGVDEVVIMQALSGG